MHFFLLLLCPPSRNWSIFILKLQNWSPPLNRRSSKRHSTSLDDLRLAENRFDTRLFFDFVYTRLFKFNRRSHPFSKIERRRPGDLDFRSLASHQLDVPNAIGKVIFPSSRSHHGNMEDEGLLVVRSNGKRNREENEKEWFKYLRLESRSPPKLMRKFWLSDIIARCEHRVLTVTVEKIPPPPKSMIVEVAIS
ncbi:unnamed protein product [Lactuca saligna]|uniref:SHSP domain-containing protein n=1 Tax=Lactuca saligna TaxID=75948 RepID=A0AA36ED82_LACSI|nr:unnamed protein product [Lactuca saligna]